MTVVLLKYNTFTTQVQNCRCGGIGRRSRLKICRWQQRAGSSPATGTTKNKEGTTVAWFLFLYLEVFVLNTSLTVGLIAEYNPFHNGHAYQLAKIREAVPGATIVVCMSGSFTQRGDAVIADKWTRASWAVRGGADLVFELPYAFACRSAEHFAAGGVQCLAGLGCLDVLAFGAESADLAPLAAAAACMDDTALQTAVHERIAAGASYAAAMSAEVAERTGVSNDVLRAPNNILAIEYLRALQRYAPSVQPLLVQRVGADYHDKAFHGKIASASAIRTLLKQMPPSPREGDREAVVGVAKVGCESLMDCPGEGSHGEIPPTAQSRIPSALPSPLPQSASLTAPSKREPYVALKRVMPKDCFAALMETMSDGLPCQDFLLRPLLAHLLTLDDATLRDIAGIGEGLEHRLLEKAGTATSWEGLITTVATRRYPQSRIARLLIHVMTGFSAEAAATFDRTGPRYLRVLAMNARGAQILHQAKKTARLPIITKTSQFLKSRDALRPFDTLSEVQQMLLYDVRATELRELALPQPCCFGADFQTSPIYVKQ